MVEDPNNGEEDNDLTKLDFSRVKNKLYGVSEELSALEEVYCRVSGSLMHCTLPPHPEDGNVVDSSPRNVTRLSSIAASDGGRLKNDEASSSSLESSLPPKSSSELVLISGYSGTGKSSLVRHLQAHPPETHAMGYKPNHYFVSGKFDQLRQAEPYSALITAFNTLLDLMLAEEDIHFQTRISYSIKQALGRSHHKKGCPSNVLPKLREFVSRHEQQQQQKQQKQQQPQPTQSEENDKITKQDPPPKTPTPPTSDDDSSSSEEDNGNSYNTNIELQNRFHLTFRALVRAICSHCRLVVLFLDDLQWADESSLDLLQMLLTDEQSKNLLVIGSYRDNEVEGECVVKNTNVTMDTTTTTATTTTTTTPAAAAAAAAIMEISSSPNKQPKQQQPHRLITCLNEIESRNVINITKIHLGNLSETSVNELISDLLRLDHEQTRPLTEVVYQKTRGNVFFVLQFLEALQSENLLTYSLSTFQWTWANPADIQAKMTITDNVEDLMANKILRLPTDVQTVLKMAACLGSCFDVEVLESIMSAWRVEATECCGCNVNVCKLEVVQVRAVTEALTKDDLVLILQRATEEGLVDRVIGGGGGDVGATSTMSYRFSHDRIQQAAYSLLPDGLDRDMLHMRIGQRLWKRLSSSKDGEMKDGHWIMFLVANQMNRGIDHLKDPEKRVELAKLNLRVGKIAITASAFVPAAAYFMFGIRLLKGTDHWTDQYDLTMELYNRSAEMEYCIGNFDKCRSLVDEVLKNAQSLYDKIGAYSTYTDSLLVQEKFEDVMHLGFDVLVMLNEKFPRKAHKANILRDFVRTKKMLRGMTDEKILTLPLMEDKNKIAAMRLLKRVASCSFFLNSKFYPLVIFRMIRLTIRYGMCSIAAIAFAMYGSILCVPLGDLKEGYRFGQLSLSIVEKLRAYDRKAEVLEMVHAFVSHWKDPLQKSLDPLLSGYDIGMQSGAIEDAMYDASMYCAFYVYSGMPLGPVEKDMRLYNRQMIEYKQDAALVVLLPVWQLVLNLMGRSDDPLVLTGDAMNQEKVLSDAFEHKNMVVVGFIYSARMELAYHFGNVELAAELAKASRKHMKHILSHFLVCRYTFLDGLISIAMARKTKKRKWFKRSRRVIQQIEKWAKHNAGNTLHMLYLLRAEYSALRAKSENVKKAFDLAIATAGRNGLLQDQALANERAGLYFLGNGNDKDWASYYLSRAYDLYDEWGAQAKADYLNKNHPSLVTPSLHKQRSLGHRSRSRFSDKSSVHKKISFDGISNSI